MTMFVFDIQRFADSPPDKPGSSSGSSSSSSVSWSGATKITSAGTYSNKTYSSTTDAQCAVLVSLASGTVNLVSPTVTKSGGPTNASDDYNFYGINSGIMATGGGNVSITGANITTTGVGANAVFSYGGNQGQNGAAGDGTTVYISDSTIKTSASGSGGIMTTGGGNTVAKNLIITTSGQSSAPIRTDRGGGNVTVTGGSYTSNGLGSPAIYSTADIIVNSATLTSNLSEGVCIEGQNSVTLNDCTLTANNTQTNGNAQFLDAIMIYQSQSGDSASGTSTFSMTGGELINKSGHLFHVTNTSAVINLNGVTINDSGDGVLLSVCDDGWSGASNIATLNASGQELTGDILVGSDSTLTLNLTDSTTFKGDIDGNIKNASGTSISTSVGTVNVSLDSSSKWFLTEDTYITSFEGTAANVITGSYNLYVNNVVLDGTTEEDTSTSKLITLTTGADSYTNTLEGATIQALAGNDTIRNTAANVSIDAGADNDFINNSAANVTVFSGAGNDSIVGSTQADLLYGGEGSDIIYAGQGDDYIRGNSGNDSLVGAYGNDTLNGDSGNDTLEGGAGNDYLYGGDGNDILDGGTGNDKIYADSGNDSINGGDGNDYIKISGSSSTALGGAGNDSIVGSTQADSLYGGEGSDIIYAGQGDDYIRGNSGNDSLVGAYGNDTLNGDSGNDTLEGGAGNDYLYGGASNDSLSGGTGNDSLWGGTGNDTLIGGSGNDIFICKANEGTDHITDYASGDLLQILNTDGTDGSYTKAAFSSSKLTLTINGGGKVVFDNVSAGDKININGTTHTISGKTLK